MRNFLLLTVLSFFFTSCEPECSAEPSCIGPPEGMFVEGTTNFSIAPGIVEEDENGSFQIFAHLDSAIIYRGTENLNIEKFYHWIDVGENPVILSIDFFYDDEMISIHTGEFVFRQTGEEFANGGYLLGIIKEQDTFTVQVDRASQDLIDGVCNDTPISC